MGGGGEDERCDQFIMRKEREAVAAKAESGTCADKVSALRSAVAQSRPKHVDD